MRDNFSVLFLAETLHALDRSTTSKCKLSNLSLLTLKFTKFLQSFLEPRVSFPSNFASLFNAMRRNSSVLFHLYLYMLWTKGAHQSANLISTADIKFNQILMSFFKRWVSFPLNFASPLTFMTHNSSEIFYLKHFMNSSSIYNFFQIFEWFNERSHSSSRHFWNHKVRVYSNFASLLSVMKIFSEDFSVFLAQTLYMLD